ncbi:HNH endonuclease signature motif containing protein [Microbacterium deminutum]|uniref:HNH endonuclease signature motif containing protein n=1 Tax=Microbacterium deminutum TaxID=344164 RepID=A0ABN2QWM0_9MICO
MNFPLGDLTAIVGVLGDLLAESLSMDAHRALGDEELMDAVRTAEHLGRWVDAARLTLAGEVGRRADSDFGDDRMTSRFGCGSAAELLERATLISGATARERLRQAKCITSRTTSTGGHRPAPLDRARAALAAGRLSSDALATVADVLRPIEARCTADDLALAETELVLAAVGDDTQAPCSIHELRIMATTWALYLDADGELPDEQHAERMRGVRLGRSRRGLRRFSGEVTDDVGAQLERLLDAHLNPRVQDRGPRFTGPGQSDEEDDEHILDPRTADQKRHDALGSILSAAAAAAETPTLGGAAPTLIVTVSADQLERADGVAFVDGPDGQAPVPASIARHVGCHGTIHRVTFGSDGAIKALTVTDRVFTHWQRKAVGARDAGCVIPGCRVRAAWCEVHHVIDHASGGPTDTSNGVLLCWHHHRTIETSGWDIRMGAGVPQVRPPAWVDPQRNWRCANRVLHRELERARSA